MKEYLFFGGAYHQKKLLMSDDTLAVKDPSGNFHDTYIKMCINDTEFFVQRGLLYSITPFNYKLIPAWLKKCEAVPTH